MRKYGELAPSDSTPDLSFTLPELCYPPRLNAVQTVLEDALSAGWGDRTAYLSGDDVFTFADVAANVHRYAAALTSLGVARGAVVMLRIPDTPELVFSLLAIQAIGAVAMPTYVQLRAEDLVYRIEDSGAALLLVSADLLDEARAVAEARPDFDRIVALPGDPSGRFRSFEEELPDGDAAPAYADTDADDLALLLYTSGSTGAPKGTCHCHRDMLAISDSYWRYSIAPGADDILAGPPSIAFALGFGMFVYFPLRLGHAAVLEPDKSPETALRLIRRHGVTIFAAVVSYYRLLTDLLDAGNPEAGVESVRRAMTGGEPLSVEVASEWKRASGLVLEEFLGTTEMLHCFITSSEPSGPPRTDRLGYAVAGYEVTVLDAETLRPVQPGEPGLLAVRGPTGTVYWNKPDDQRAAVRGGWCIFQDLVTRDADGYFRYLARHDEMIVSAGYNISPIQVESILARHPAVRECACVPAPDPTELQERAITSAIWLRPRSDGP